MQCFCVAMHWIGVATVLEAVLELVIPSDSRACAGESNRFLMCELHVHGKLGSKPQTSMLRQKKLWSHSVPKMNHSQMIVALSHDIHKQLLLFLIAFCTTQSLWCSSAHNSGHHNWWWVFFFPSLGTMRQWPTKCDGLTNSNLCTLRCFFPVFVWRHIEAAFHSVVNKLDLQCWNSHVSTIAKIHLQLFSFVLVLSLKP